MKLYYTHHANYSCPQLLRRNGPPQNRYHCTVTSFPAKDDKANLSLEDLSTLLHSASEMIQSRNRSQLLFVSNFTFHGIPQHIKNSFLCLKNIDSLSTDVPKPVVKVVLEDDEERAIGDTYNIEVMRRNWLHCSYDFIEGRQLHETNSPVVTSWLLLNDEDNEFYNIPESFISKSRVSH